MVLSSAAQTMIIRASNSLIPGLRWQTRLRACTYQDNRIPFFQDLRRPITSTTSRTLLKFLKTTSSSTPDTNKFSITGPQFMAPKEDLGKNEDPSSSWTNPSIKEMGSKEMNNMGQLFRNWTSPSGEKPFPFSQHPSRNSHTTPKEDVYLNLTSDAVIEKALIKKIYAQDTEWEKIFEGTSLSDKLMELSNQFKPKSMRQLLSLSPSSGRTVFITPRIDIMKAFRQMEMSCGRNRVRREATAQRFHERPGLKRKRLKSSRWRQRFSDSFKATLSRVQDLRSQGW